MEKESLQDEMDKSSIDQLHKVVLQLGTNCFELKKLCATILVSASALIATFTQKTLDTSFFVGSLFIIAIFWVLDVQSYYYQEKLRKEMKRLADEIFKRHQKKFLLDGVGMPLGKERDDKSRLIRSFFNSSMLFYLLLVILNAFIFYLFMISKIGQTES